ncbi:efflux RND transporter periplasmic adaptor subunit [Flavobacteriaceae bacterium Ap0902]|nr:efflux RND transporter periplasmic adaptor subunit [Flavobacteriaceae bacterium Ap0902]
MNKNIIYVLGALLIGLLIGYLVFNNPTEDHSAETAVHDHTEDDTQMWTCSMHPQIMQPEPGQCPICGMDLIPADAGTAEVSPNDIRMTKNAMALANIQTIIVRDAYPEKSNTLSLSGKIMRNEETFAVQASYFEGRIEKLHVNFTGEEVRKGQLLASIYAPSLVNAQQELITTASIKDTQPELYSAVRNKLKLWKLSESQINQIERSGKIKEIFPIYATVSGTVSEKLANEGDYVSKGQPILKLSNLGTVWAMFDVYENQISSLKIGQKIKVTTQAYPDKIYETKIAFIDPILNTASRTTTIRATLNNRGRLLKPGMFAIAEVEGVGGSDASDLLIPASAVMWTGERSLVYIKTNPNEPVFQMREVKVGTRAGDMYSVREGLNPGDEVVTNGTFTIDAAAQIQGKNSMMNHANVSQDMQHGEHDQQATFQRIKDVPSAFQNQLKTLFNDYIQLKDALVADKAIQAQSMAKNLENDLGKIDVQLLKDKRAKDTWDHIQKDFRVAVNSIASTTHIEEQRNHFIDVSTAITHGIQAFGINQTVYSAYCPMANNNQGASWLTLKEEVRNPYFGASMLNCGDIQETIQ